MKTVDFESKAPTERYLTSQRLFIDALISGTRTNWLDKRGRFKAGDAHNGRVEHTAGCDVDLR